jgi:hypothetical protein
MAMGLINGTKELITMYKEGDIDLTEGTLSAFSLND